jgi:hypothetical protein
LRRRLGELLGDVPVDDDLPRLEPVAAEGRGGDEYGGDRPGQRGAEQAT